MVLGSLLSSPFLPPPFFLIREGINDKGPQVKALFSFKKGVARVVVLFMAAFFIKKAGVFMEGKGAQGFVLLFFYIFGLVSSLWGFGLSKGTFYYCSFRRAGSEGPLPSFI